MLKEAVLNIRTIFLVKCPASGGGVDDQRRDLVKIFLSMRGHKISS